MLCQEEEKDQYITQWRFGPCVYRWFFLGTCYKALPIACCVTCQLCPSPRETRAPLGLCKPLRRCSVIRILHRKQQPKASANSRTTSNSERHAKHNVKITATWLDLKAPYYRHACSTGVNSWNRYRETQIYMENHKIKEGTLAVTNMENPAASPWEWASPFLFCSRLLSCYYLQVRPAIPACLIQMKYKAVRNHSLSIMRI